MFEMDDEDRISGLAELLMETGHSHHEAFLATDGADPEWPLWYSQYLQNKVGAFLDGNPTRSEIIHSLLNAEEAYSSQNADQSWTLFYAGFLISIGDGGLHNPPNPTES